MSVGVCDVIQQDKAIVPLGIFKMGIKALRAGAKVPNATPLRMKDR